MSRFIAGAGFAAPTEPPQRVRKRAVEVSVRFAAAATAVQSPEGPVHAQPGDALVSDAEGRCWRVAAERFGTRYEALPPTRMGEAGRYRSRPSEARAWRRGQGFELLLSDGLSLLRGQAGDWLLDYGDGHLGIVAAQVFDSSYELLD